MLRKATALFLTGLFLLPPAPIAVAQQRDMTATQYDYKNAPDYKHREQKYGGTSHRVEIRPGPGAPKNSARAVLACETRKVTRTDPTTQQQITSIIGDWKVQSVSGNCLDRQKVYSEQNNAGEVNSRSIQAIPLRADDVRIEQYPCQVNGDGIHCLQGDIKPSSYFGYNDGQYALSAGQSGFLDTGDARIEVQRDTVHNTEMMIPNPDGQPRNMSLPPGQRYRGAQDSYLAFQGTLQGLQPDPNRTGIEKLEGACPPAKITLCSKAFASAPNMQPDGTISRPKSPKDYCEFQTSAGDINWNILGGSKIRIGAIGNNYWCGTCQTQNRTIRFWLSDNTDIAKFRMQNVGYDDYMSIKVNGHRVMSGPRGGDPTVDRGLLQSCRRNKETGRICSLTMQTAVFDGPAIIPEPKCSEPKYVCRRIDKKRVCSWEQQCTQAPSPNYIGPCELNTSWKHNVDRDIKPYLKVGENVIQMRVIVSGCGEGWFHLRATGSDNKLFCKASPKPIDRSCTGGIVRPWSESGNQCTAEMPDAPHNAMVTVSDPNEFDGVNPDTYGSATFQCFNGRYTAVSGSCRTQRATCDADTVTWRGSNGDYCTAEAPEGDVFDSVTLQDGNNGAATFFCEDNTWKLDSGTCDRQQNACPATSVTWGGDDCSGSLPSASNGSSRSVIDGAGIATYSCSNGSWSLQGGTCPAEEG
ncbi:hypothetical protein CKO28_00510 [Rhodovibrio sodomensis]|uniref:Conjugal transfer protein TraN n=1 Tax=Rhodovibrio sodomensis TaxID=1088 RepID=A0ABS1D7X7_9PROT|nr:hypothetical protein [Rhodovibrio sodomensis]MBK1666522.1 hypothetical protein [Rhodovibrio sodomensis]